jgi:hypothetical protein
MVKVSVSQQTENNSSQIPLLGKNFVCQGYMESSFGIAFSPKTVKVKSDIFYSPRKISGEHNYSRRLVRPSVPFSCPGHNFEATRGINMKLYS